MCSPRRDTSNATPLETATHLVILQHGLLGSNHDFARFVDIFRAHFQSEEFLYLHACESNASKFFQTYDGVDQGGERLADEIQELAMKMPNSHKFSMIGHSLGGLYNRYCIGLLLMRGFFDKIEPMNFVTLATPHLGIRRPRRGATNAIFNALIPNIFSRTGAQLTLSDAATEETQALSHSSNAYQDKKFHPALSDVSGSLLVSFPASEKRHDDAQKVFELFDCVLSGGKLQVFESKEEADKNKVKFEIDLCCTDVQILLPSGRSTGDDTKFYSSFIRQNEESEQSNESGNFDIQIRWPTRPTKAADTHLCVLRIPEDNVHHDWRWLVALSNASFGVRCVTSTGSTNVAQQQISTTPPLLSCLTRGQFMQALQMFKVRTLYSNIFFDMQVPYTCAAVRAFNPYRSSAKKFLMSPIYIHIALDCLKSAQKLRDTVPLKVKRLASKRMMPNRTAQALISDSEEQPQDGRDVEGSNISTGNSTPSSSRRNGRHASDSGRRSTSVDSDSGRHRHLFHSRCRGKTAGSAPSHRSIGSRPVPFIDGDVILDQLPYAFTADVEQDELRGMLLSMQSVGWRRIDVLFGGIMAHEHIIAKRANLDKPLDSGIDIVHHVMDTFLL